MNAVPLSLRLKCPLTFSCKGKQRPEHERPVSPVGYLTTCGTFQRSCSGGSSKCRSEEASSRDIDLGIAGIKRIDQGFPLPLPAASQQLIKPLLEIVESQSQKKAHFELAKRDLKNNTCQILSFSPDVAACSLSFVPLHVSLATFTFSPRSKAADWFICSFIHSLTVMD